MKPANVPDNFRLDGVQYNVVARNDDGSVDAMADGKRVKLPAGQDYSMALPTDKKGVVQFTELPVTATVEYFTARVDDAQARAELIENNRKAAEKELAKYDKRPNVGTDPDAYAAVLDEWKAKKAAAQAKVDYWAEVAQVNDEVQRSDTREAINENIPVEIEQTPDEFVAGVLGGIKITPESFRRETGLGGSEQRSLVGLIANEVNGGVSVERAAEIIMENYADELAGLGFNGDVQEVRDMIINLLSNGNPRSYAKKGKELRAQELKEQRMSQLESIAAALNFESAEEMALWEETVIPAIIVQHQGFDENEYYTILANEYNNNSNNDYDTTRTGQTVGGSSDILQGEQLIDNGGTESVADGQQGGAIPSDVQGGGQNAATQAVEQVADQSEDNLEMGAQEHPTIAAANEGKDTVGGSPVALAYLLEGGQGSILNAGYFLHGVAAAFPAISNEIEALRAGMSGDVLGMNPTDFANQRAGEVAQIGELIVNAYGEEGAAIYNELLNNASGFVPREGKEIGARIEALQPIENNSASNALQNENNVGSSEIPNNQATLSQESDQVSDQVAEGNNALESHARGIAQRLGVNVTLHNDASTIADESVMMAIADGEEVKGWYNPRTGEIALYMPNMESVRDVESTILHEAVSHYGIKHLLGREEFNKFLDGVWQMMPASERARYLQYVNADVSAPSLADMRAAADEYVAHLAEGMDLNDLEKGVWQRIVDFVMNVLRGRGFTNLSYADVESVIRASYANLRTNAEISQAEVFSEGETMASKKSGNKKSPNTATPGKPVYTTEEQQIIDKAKQDGTYMKAPNGEPTKLSPKQWAQVRTEAFKKWFGDWEASFKKNFLLNGKPVAALTGDEFTPIEGKKLTEQVEAYFASIGGKAVSPLFGDVILDRKGADDSLSHGMGRNKAIAYAAVKETIENGVLVDAHTNHKERGYDTAIIAAPIEINGERYVCMVVVKRNANENRFYLHEVTAEKNLRNDAFVTNSAQKPASVGDIAKVLQNIVSASDNVSKVLDESENSAAETRFRKAAAEIEELASSIEERLPNIKGLEYAELENLLRDLGQLNAMAHKGYGRINDAEWQDNARIYSLKSKAVEALAEEWKHRGLEVSDWMGVIYFRTKDGMQISFHRRPRDFSYSEVAERRRTEWDGVLNAWSYTNVEEYEKAKEAYQLAKEEYERKEKEDKEVLLKHAMQIKDALISILNNKRTRKNFGLPESKEDFIRILDSRPLSKDGLYKDSRFVANVIQQITGVSYGSAGDLAWRVAEKLGERAPGLVYEKIKEELNTPFSEDFNTIYIQAAKKTVSKDAEGGVRFRKTSQERATQRTVQQLESIMPVNVATEEQAREVMALMEGGAVEAMTVYHGSGAKFDKFDHAFMGTGEGAQAYGWGSYVTEVEGVGRSYATTMRDKAISEKHKENAILNNLARQTLASNNGDKNAALDELRNLLNESWSDKKRVKAEIKIIETGKFLPETKVKANLYTVEIPDDNGSNYLHWEKRGDAELQERVLNGLMKIGFEIEPDGNHITLTRAADMVVLNSNATGADLYTELSEALGSDKAASQFLNDMGFVGISYPAQAMTGGRADKARNYVVFNEDDLQITNRVEFYRTENGTIYGWAVNGEVWLTPDGMNPDTPVHEYTHLWASAVEKNNPGLWARIVEGLRDSAVWKEVLADEGYRGIRDNENRMASEVLSRLSGRENYAREMQRAKAELDAVRDNVIDAAEKISAWERVKRAVSDFWNGVKEMLGLPVEGAVKEDSPAWMELVEMPLNDFWNGVKPDAVQGEGETIRLRKVDWNRNRGYTQREDGSRISVRAAEAEEEGAFTPGTFRKVYGVSKADFDALVEIGAIVNSEWHHTGANFKESDFYSWSDRGDMDYAKGVPEDGSLGDIYRKNKKEISQLVKDYQSQDWEYDDKRSELYLPTLDDFASRVVRLNAEEQANAEKEHAEISEGGEALGSSYIRRAMHEDVDAKYAKIARERFERENPGELGRLYEKEYGESIAFNKGLAERNKAAEEHNKQTAGKEVTLLKIADILGVDAQGKVEVVSRVAREKAKRELRKAEAESIKQSFDAEMQRKQKAIDKWVSDQRKKGGIKDVERILQKEAPELFITEKEEMNGRYGWFEANTWRYNMPVYVSGMEFANKRLYDSYKKKVKEIKDAQNRFDAEYRNFLYEKGNDGSTLREMAGLADVQEDGIRFRRGNGPSAQDIYEEKVSRIVERNKQGAVTAARRAREAYVDSMESLKALQDAIAEERGRAIQSNEDAYTEENHLSSKNKIEMEAFSRDFSKPLQRAIAQLQSKGADMKDILHYLIAKHGLERNRVFSQRDAEKDGGKWNGKVKDYSGLTELTNSATGFTALAEKMVADFEANYNTAELWKSINAATKWIWDKEYNAGMMTKEQYALDKRFQYYVPLRGWDVKEAADEYEYLTSSANLMPLASKKAQGRKSVADNPIANILYLAQSVVVRGNRNKKSTDFFSAFFVEHTRVELVTF